MNPAQVSLVLALKCYRTFVSPLKSAVLGPFARCRYSPTCSQYAEQAVRFYGAGKGSYLAVRRVCRCHPWGGFGFDPLPTRSNHS